MALAEGGQLVQHLAGGALDRGGDRLLVQRIRANEPGAWDDLFKRYQGRLAAYVRRRLRDHAAVDDVVHNTFVGFLNSLLQVPQARAVSLSREEMAEVVSLARGRAKAAAAELEALPPDRSALAQ